MERRRLERKAEDDRFALKPWPAQILHLVLRIRLLPIIVYTALAAVTLTTIGWLSGYRAIGPHEHRMLAAIERVIPDTRDRMVVGAELDVKDEVRFLVTIRQLLGDPTPVTHPGWSDALSPPQLRYSPDRVSALRQLLDAVLELPEAVRVAAVDQVIAASRFIRDPELNAAFQELVKLDRPTLTFWFANGAPAFQEALKACRRIGVVDLSVLQAQNNHLLGVYATQQTRRQFAEQHCLRIRTAMDRPRSLNLSCQIYTAMLNKCIDEALVP